MHRRAWQRILVCAGALASMGCSAAEKTPARPNIVVAVFDTLRADHLGAYGYDRDTSPTIDRLAEAGVLFERAYSNSSFTRESIASLLTGLYPTRGGHTGWHAAPRAPERTLPRLLAESGYATALVSSAVILDVEGFTNLFDHHAFVGTAWDAVGAGPLVVDAALEWARDQIASDRPFFLYLHFIDPHGPYNPPAPYDARFAPEPPEERLRIYEDVRRNFNDHRDAGLDANAPRFRDLIDRYDAEIAHEDQSLQRLLDGLEAAGTLDDTVVAITADHGEEFLEHGYVEHAWTLYEEVVRVPLILWQERMLAPAVVSEPVSGADVMPSLLHVAGLDAPAELDGIPFVAREADSFRVVVPEHTLTLEMLVENRCRLRAVVDGKWKYMAAIRWLEPRERQPIARDQFGILEAYLNGERPLEALDAPPVREMLFDLAQDPGEQEKLLEARPEEAARYRRLLEAYVAAYADDTARPEVLGLDEERRQALEALGYVSEDSPVTLEGEDHGEANGAGDEVRTRDP